MKARIPARGTSKYAGQYAGALDLQRIVEIFADSYTIALSSKNPETARDRFALAVEAYHQVMSFVPPIDIEASVQQRMENLAELFPAQVLANQAVGLRERSHKLKTVRKRLALLRQAQEILDRGLAEYPTSSVLQAAAADLGADISLLEPTTP